LAPDLKEHDRPGYRGVERADVAAHGHTYCLVDLVTVAQAAEELGVSPHTIRGAIMRGQITPVALDKRTNLIPRSEIERYRRQHKGQHGKRPQQHARYEDVRCLYREHYKGGRGRTARWDEGWSVERVARETGYSVPRVYAIVAPSHAAKRKKKPATEPAE
jgi:excisionase family DNA binding protein